MSLSIAHFPESPDVKYGSGWSGMELFGNKSTESPSCCGICELEPGASNTVTSKYVSYGVYLEGEGEIVESSKPDEVKTVKAGDVFHAEPGSTVTWTARTKMRSFYVVHKELGEATSAFNLA
ncbi:hypothetical protein RhiLY_12336 [Ceratobasidium sp. AG-Ba]|nr:hypothetical protein RhiLY_12336 [Ceratobasidium sp. AG-Ba]